ncbi:uncharacterized protein LOC8280920 [Ricinus communis]|uniref:uncharacterized protein LOC8280920 n=1 Tax=Ricinus communis TaxID=3988 RepID=UPI00201A3AF8|nr:uncharacterized protein LOC8280920 [Ricinus communis]
MRLTVLRKPTSLTSLVSSYLLSRACNFCSKASTFNDKTNSNPEKTSPAPNYSSNIHLSPLFSSETHSFNAYNIELVDNDAWQVKSGLTHMWRGSLDRGLTEANSASEAFNEQVNDGASLQGDSDFDEIDNMRIRGNLFYKLDKNSKEFEEYNFDFHRKRSSNKKNDSSKESKGKENPKAENLPKKTVRNQKICSLHLINDMDASINVAKKKVRTPTFNQLTGPYHEPFCLDIYISKASVRACVIHRVTSKVVAVAHSISKDLKFDLSSTRNVAACATVGAVLAQRALADDIHDVIYTPRKGEKLEGKLQIVLQSIVDNGINVKVKLKQRQRGKASLPQSA